MDSAAGGIAQVGLMAGGDKFSDIPSGMGG
jgi:hypothetical protein